LVGNIIQLADDIYDLMLLLLLLLCVSQYHHHVAASVARLGENLIKNVF